MTVVPIGQYLTQFGKAVEFDAAELRRDDGMPLLSLDPRVEEEQARRIEEAQMLAREEGRAAAAEEFDLERAKERADFEARSASERETWLAEEGSRLSGVIGAALEEMETRIADSVARILEPFLEAALRQRVVAELAATLSALLSEGEPLLKVSGPQPLLDALREKLGESRSSVEYLPAETTDISAVAEHTVIETRLKAWIDRFHQAVEG